MFNFIARKIATNSTKSMLFSQGKTKLNHFGWNSINMPFINQFAFSKKSQPPKKKSEAPKPVPKTEQDYMRGADHAKKNIIEVKQMQTTSEAELEVESLRTIIIQQRNLLTQSLKQQIENALKKPEQVEGVKKKSLLQKYFTQEQLNKYYVRRPLKYLQNIYYGLFFTNAAGYVIMQFMNSYSSMGWFFASFTAPTATSCIAMLLGYNLCFWIVRQSLHMHLSLNELSGSNINLISSQLRNIGQLTFIIAQFAALVYALSFPCPISMYKMYILLATTNIATLMINLHTVLQAANISYRVYSIDFVRIVSLTSLIVLLFSVYYVQISAAAQPQKLVDDVNYRQRVIEMRSGYTDFLKIFKQKKYLMKENQKINFMDD